MIKRLFIEIDEAEEGRLETLLLQASFAEGFGSDTEKVQFDKVIPECAYHIEETWASIKEAEKIFFDSALIQNHMNISSGVLFNNLMWKAIEEKIENKELYVFRYFKEVQWDNLKRKLVEQCFAKNKIYTLEEVPNTYDHIWVEVKLEKLIEESA